MQTFKIKVGSESGLAGSQTRDRFRPEWGPGDKQEADLNTLFQQLFRKWPTRAESSPTWAASSEKRRGSCLWPSVCPSDCPTDVESVRLSRCRVFIDTPWRGGGEEAGWRGRERLPGTGLQETEKPAAPGADAHFTATLKQQHKNHCVAQGRLGE